MITDEMTEAKRVAWLHEHCQPGCTLTRKRTLDGVGSIELSVSKSMDYEPRPVSLTASVQATQLADGRFEFTRGGKTEVVESNAGAIQEYLRKLNPPAPIEPLTLEDVGEAIARSVPSVCAGNHANGACPAERCIRRDTHPDSMRGACDGQGGEIGR